MKYLLLKDGVTGEIENVIELGGDAEKQFDGKSVVRFNGPANPGDNWNGSTVVPAPPPPKTGRQQKAAALGSNSTTQDIVDYLREANPDDF